MGGRAARRAITRLISVQVVVKDAAAGIAAGVSEVFPDAQQRDDCFHGLYELSEVRRRLERRAYRAIGKEVQAQQALGQVRACQVKKRKPLHGRLLVWAQRQCREAIERYDSGEQGFIQVRDALACVDLDRGQLRDAQTVQTRIEQQCEVRLGLGNEKA